METKVCEFIVYLPSIDVKIYREGLMLRAIKHGIDYLPPLVFKSKSFMLRYIKSSFNSLYEPIKE